MENYLQNASHVSLKTAPTITNGYTWKNYLYKSSLDSAREGEEEERSNEKIKLFQTANNPHSYAKRDCEL
ncbi:CLUMA_CG010846, isoform A [Clunio marinus]|uniref:CLUMA_CG010846, isoform A n=1 Tax=Clunio marinus TaxID=568069 RepID=A0A1J1IG82_9DIPT|nr:CLUMA_CG010846, isoform A [Clunio marinus]